MKRHRFKQDRTLGERLLEEARGKGKAGHLPPGAEREDLLTKAHVRYRCPY